MKKNNITKNSLGSTARWTAAARAKESMREDRLFDDPWAAALAGTEGSSWAITRPPDSLAPMVLRIRFFDDFLQRITREDAIHQVVLMAAGLDIRAFRMAWPAGTNVFELDQPAVLQDKEQTLHAAGAQTLCARHTIEVDLMTGSWKKALIKAGFEPSQPSAWLLEGFLFYIPIESIAHLLDEVNSLSTSGSWLGFDIIYSATMTSPYTHQWIKMQANSSAPWIGTMKTRSVSWQSEVGRRRLPRLALWMPTMAAGIFQLFLSQCPICHITGW